MLFPFTSSVAIEDVAIAAPHPKVLNLTSTIPEIISTISCLENSHFYSVELYDTLKYKPNQILGIPAYYEKLLDSELMKGQDLSHLKLVASGGDHISPNLEVKLNNFLEEHNSKAKFVKGYGMTELSSSACTCLENVNEISSVGVPLVKNSISIFDPETLEEKKPEIKTLDYIQFDKLDEIIEKLPLLEIKAEFLAEVSTLASQAIEKERNQILRQIYIDFREIIESFSYSP